VEPVKIRIQNKNLDTGVLENFRVSKYILKEIFFKKKLVESREQKKVMVRTILYKIEKI